MSERRPVAVLLNDSTSDAQLTAFQQACPHPCAVYRVKDATGLQHAVRQVYAKGTAVYEAVVNLCVDESDSTSGVSAAIAAVFLDQCGLPYSGCRAATLNYPFDVLLMMLWYAEVPLPPFAIIDSPAAATRATQVLKAPIRIRNACALLGLHEEVCTSQNDAEAALLHAYQQHGKLVAWQVSASTARTVRVLVAGGDVKGAAAAVPLGAPRDDPPPAWLPEAEASARQCGAAVSRHVLYGCGIASLTLGTLEEDPTRWCFQDITLNPPLGHILPTHDAEDALTGGPALTEVLMSLIVEAQRRHPVPTFEIRLHHDSRKGYHLCAARALRENDLVFEDECRSFAVVTRPHVEQHWDATLKKTFTEYAWPLDSEGHLYAIWEENPQRWRPINHSCDPNCVFAAPHSLNVIAARDIAAGEDLSMDYATFCDGTMKPFQCLCGAATCRGLISPDAASLAKYGQHAWLRRVPPPVKPLLPQ